MPTSVICKISIFYKILWRNNNEFYKKYYDGQFNRKHKRIFLRLLYLFKINYYFVKTLIRN